MGQVSGEILEITPGTPGSREGISVLCRSTTDALGQIKVFYLLSLGHGTALGMLIVAVAAAAVEERTNDAF